MSASSLQKLFPGLVLPIICNGPMAGAASAAMAAEVSKAGGIGFLGCVTDISPGSPMLASLDADLASIRSHTGIEAPAPLAAGPGFITGHKSIGHFSDTALPIIKKHSPGAIWLFAPEEDVQPHGRIIAAVKALERPPLVFVQVGNVKAAREAARDGADVIICQGIDAGGHQFRRGAGVVSLVPGVRAMLKEEFPERDVVLLGAGGIVNGEGVAAVMALGAAGAVLGTRFVVAPESLYPEFRKQIVLNAKDGGTETFKSEFNDELVKSPLWGPLYDGRGIIGPLQKKFLAGASLKECQDSLASEYSTEEAAKIANTWCGTGVGLVNKAQPAGEIVREVRDEASATIKRLAGLA